MDFFQPTLKTVNEKTSKIKDEIKFDFKLKPETKNKLIFLVICFGLVFLIYGRSILGDFVFDDRNIVERQAWLSNINLLDKILVLPYWSQADGAYRPVTLASYTLNFLLLGSDPAGFHFVNLFLYALTGFLIYLFVDRLFKKNLLAYLSGIIFLILPIHTEVAANIIGRAEILALFFSLLALIELIKDKKDEAGVKKYKKYWLAGLWFFLAIGSKETAVAVLPLAVLIVYFNELIIKNFFWHKEILFKYLPAWLWLAAGAVAYFALRLMVLGQQYFLSSQTSLVENPLRFVAAGPRIITAFAILWLYVKKSFWPFNLCSDYSFNQISVLHAFNAQAILGISFFILIIVGIFLFFRRAPILSLGSAFFLFSFLPAANIIFPAGTIMGERLMYYPSVGLSFYLAYGLYIIYNLRPHKIFTPSDKIVDVSAVKNKLVPVNNFNFKKGDKYLAGFGYLAISLFIVLAVFYSVIGFLRAGDWLTEKRLFVSAAKCAPNSVLSRSNLGAQYYLAGDLAAAKKELLAAQKIYDGYPKGVNNLGLIYWQEGDRAKARELFLKAMDLPFPYYGAWENLALVSLAEGKIDEARTWLLKFYSGDKITVETIIQNYLMAVRLKN